MAFVFSDSQAALKSLGTLGPGAGQQIRKHIQQEVAKAGRHGLRIKARWTPAHVGVPGNEKADEEAKRAADTGELRSMDTTDDWTSIAHLRRLVSEEKSEQEEEWFAAECSKRTQTYRYIKTRKHMRPVETSSKTLPTRFFQLKSNHAQTGDHLLRINTLQTDACWHCSTMAPQTREHSFFECRKWTTHRAKLLKAVQWNPARRKDCRILFASAVLEHTEAILDFLRGTDVGTRRGMPRPSPESECEAGVDMEWEARDDMRGFVEEEDAYG